MKGKLQKLSKGWTIWYNEDPVGGNISFVDSLPLYPLGVANMIDDSYNGEEVEFEIQDFWETGLEEVIKIAVLTSNNEMVEPHISDNFQIGPDGAYEHEDDSDWDVTLMDGLEDEDFEKKDTPTMSHKIRK